MNPSQEEIKQWQEIAKRRKAILPQEFRIITSKEVGIICGHCSEYFIRPLIVAQNDPIYVCPKCQNRNYVPIDWNVTKRLRRY